ncbi:MAG TPA: hypothetical protein VLB44_26650 [Kofleriaceae bacterium]|nr:hypothetical protein [Kofleriaceae bacterium]
MRYPALSFGSVTMPVSGKYFNKITWGPYSGVTEFFLGGRLDTSSKFDALLIEVPEPAGGFQTNVPYAFQSDATAMTYDAIAYILGDFDTTANSYAQMYWADQGTITFSQITKAANADIVGTVTMTSMHQIDDNTGAAITGGCTTSVTSVSFFLKQNAALPREGVTQEPKDLGALGTLETRIDHVKALQELH